MAHYPRLTRSEDNSLAVGGAWLLSLRDGKDRSGEKVTAHGRQRPDAVTRIVDRLKLHRRRVRLRGRDFTVITLRPGTDARFSTKFFHGTWHILSDWHGARLLGRLLWGLAYQRVPSTLVLIDRPFLDPNPFDAEPSDPIAFVPVPLTPLSSKAARELRERLPLSGPPDGTVRWQTDGLDVLVAAHRGERDYPGSRWRPAWLSPRGFHDRMGRAGGLVTLTATSYMLTRYAADIYTLGEYSPEGMAWTEVDRARGEVQILRDYRRRVSAARIARRELLAELPDQPPPDVLNPLIWERVQDVRHRSGCEVGPPAPGSYPMCTPGWPGPTKYWLLPPGQTAAP